MGVPTLLFYKEENILVKKEHKKNINTGTIKVIADEIASSLGISVISADFAFEFGKNILRVILDKPGGIAINDCENFSRKLSPRLDETDLFNSRYYLEVSSPGI